MSVGIPKSQGRLSRMAAATTSTTAMRWPDDYIPWDAGRLLVYPEFTTALESRGWQSVAEIMNDRDVEVIRHLNGRDNCRVRLPCSGGPVLLYLKRHWMRGRRRYPGMDEANAVGACQRLNVPTMEIAAAGFRTATDSRGRKISESFSLSVAFERPSAFDEVQGWREAGEFDRPQNQARLNELIAAIAATARRLHRANHFQQDFYWQHLFHELGSPIETGAAIIDVQRLVRRYGPWKLWWWVKDLDQLRYSMQRLQLPAQCVEQWYADYFERAVADRKSAAERLLRILISVRGGRRLRRLRKRQRCEGAK